MRDRLAIAAAGLLLGLLVLPDLAAGQADRWQAHTSFRSVQALDVAGTTIWAATSGGVFGYETGSGSISRYTAVEGLHGVEARVIASDDARGDIWIGYGDGVLDRLDPETGTITTFRDIARADQFSSRGINGIEPVGDSLLIATDFGVVVFDPERREVRDSYTRLGAISPAAPANDVVVGSLGGPRQIWVATDEGLATAPMDGRNLQDPAQWSLEQNGLPAGGEILSVALFDGRIYVGTSGDLYVRSPGGTFAPQGLTSTGVFGLRGAEDELIGVGRFRPFVVRSGGSIDAASVPGYERPTAILRDAQGVLWLGDRLGGLLQISDIETGNGSVSVVTTVLPEGPAEPQFADLSFTSDGVLWAAAVAGSQGFHRLDASGTWTAFTGTTVQALEGRSRYTSIMATNDRAIAGSEGSGVALVEADGTVETFDTSNSSLAPAAGTSDFIIVGGVSMDSDDQLWATTRGSGVPLHVRTEDGTWAGRPPFVGEGLSNSSTAYGSLYIDSFDQKWIIVRDETNFNRVRGLMVVDTRRSPDDFSDDSFRFFGERGSAGQGLPSVGVTSVVEDRDGLVWVGTDGGIAYFVNTGVVARDQNARAIWPPWADRSLGAFVLFGLRTNDLAIDPANRLWVATNEGAWLIEAAEFGYRLVAQFTSENSPLFSDNVLSIAVDPTTGRVFFSTDRGLVSYAGDAVAASEEGGDLYLYPNPANPATFTGSITIEGLADQSDIRIVTASGSLIAAFESRGGRAVWDGRDRNGREVPTGMYLVVAVGQETGKPQRGRLAIIR